VEYLDTTPAGWHVTDLPGLPAFRTSGPPPLGRVTTLYAVLNLPPTQLRRYLAVHEAAHVVIGIQGGSRVHHVELDTDLGTGDVRDQVAVGDAGAAHVTWLPTTVTWTAHLTMLAAGERAQLAWLREHDLYTSDRAWAVEVLAAQDRLAAVADGAAKGITLAFGEAPDPDVLDWILVCQWADGQLSRSWPTVLAVAAALDDNSRLSGAEIAALL
jgi:hypothetical protein